MTQCRPMKYAIEISKYQDETDNEIYEKSKLGYLSPTSLTDFLKEQSNNYPGDMLQILNYSLRQYIINGDLEIGNCVYPLAFHQPGNELGNVIKIHGFIRSFRPTQQGLALSVDMISRFFHRSIKVLEFLKAILFYKEVDFYNMKQIFNRNL